MNPKDVLTYLPDVKFRNPKTLYPFKIAKRLTSGKVVPTSKSYELIREGSFPSLQGWTHPKNLSHNH